MTKKKHAGTHLVCQIGHLSGQYLWINPAVFLQFSQDGFLQILGGAIGIFVAILGIAKKLKWW